MASTKKEFRYSLAPFLAFRDEKVCARVRAIRKANICRHKNPGFRISIVETVEQIMFDYALDLVSTIKRYA